MIRSNTLTLRRTNARRIYEIALKDTSSGEEVIIDVQEEPGGFLIVLNGLTINEAAVSKIELSLETVKFHFVDFDDMVLTQNVVSYVNGIVTIDFAVPFEVYATA